MIPVITVLLLIIQGNEIFAMENPFASRRGMVAFSPQYMVGYQPHVIVGVPHEMVVDIPHSRLMDGLNGGIAGLHDNVATNIFGGRQVDISQFPYQVSLMKGGSHHCGGSIIKQTFILTAAHCLDGAATSSIVVRVGSSYNNVGGTNHRVAKIHVHPKYYEPTLTYDIGLLELMDPIYYHARAQPIAMAESGYINHIHSMATVTGWGLYEDGNTAASKVLQAVKVPIISKKKCKDSYRELVIASHMICAGYYGGKKDACAGDSGGPLVINDKQIGIVSWGVGCAQMNTPGVYTSISAFKDYIDRITSKARM